MVSCWHDGMVSWWQTCASFEPENICKRSARNFRQPLCIVMLRSTHFFSEKLIQRNDISPAKWSYRRHNHVAKSECDDFVCDGMSCVVFELMIIPDTCAHTDIHTISHPVHLCTADITLSISSTPAHTHAHTLMGSLPGLPTSFVYLN